MTSQSLPSLAPKDLQDWLKRFRRAIAPLKIRYFATGEYGDDTQRPHYHVALFGWPNCAYGNSRYSRYRQNCCYQCDLVRDTWGKGQIFSGDLSPESAGYIAGYVTKKLTRHDDPRLLGRHPEFARMSLRPGIGADFMHEVASTFLSIPALDGLEDVPGVLQHGRRKLPLGRYLRRRLRILVGRAPDAPPSAIEAVKAEMLPVREAAFNASQDFKEAYVESNHQARLNQSARRKLFNKRKTL